MGCCECNFNESESLVIVQNERSNLEKVEKSENGANNSEKLRITERALTSTPIDQKITCSEINVFTLKLPDNSSEESISSWKHAVSPI